MFQLLFLQHVSKVTNCIFLKVSTHLKTIFVVVKGDFTVDYFFIALKSPDFFIFIKNKHECLMSTSFCGKN